MTKDGRERELKFSIPREEDWRLLRDGPGWGTRGAPALQTNYYFDTGDRSLVRSGTLLRIRESGGILVLTLKYGRETSPGYFDSAEVEAPLPADGLARALEDPGAILDWDLDPIREVVRLHGRPRLGLLGTLENERVKRRVEAGAAGELVLEVDRLRFRDGTEAYELEIEVGRGEAEAAAAWVEGEAARSGVKLEPERATKLERLLAWMDRSSLKGG